MSASLRVPRQARSVETLNRLLDAAEAVMEQKSFDDATIEEIVSRAGVTTGAFYARFRNKEALFRHLEDRLTREFIAIFAEATDPARFVPPRAETILRHIIAVWAREYFRRRATARALLLRSHTDPALRRRVQNLNRLNFLKSFRLLSRQATVRHDTPAFALDFALLAARCVLRETILFREVWPSRMPLSEETIVEEVTRMTLRYLGIEPGGGVDSPEDEDP